MRTTVDIPDALYRQLKASAAHQGRSVRALLLEAAERALGEAPGRAPRRVRLPLIEGKRPGTLRLSHAAIHELVDLP